ncbi:MAG: polysaccharide biosynthesis protein [Dehalococcoidia bacterium]
MVTDNSLFRNRQRLGALLVLAMDAAIVVVGYAAALLLRFDSSVPVASWRWFGYLVLPIVLAYIAANAALGVYRVAWRYGSLRDVLNLAAAVAVVTGVVFAINLLLPYPRHIPLSVNLVAGALIFPLMAFGKLWPRLVASGLFAFGGWDEATRRVLIVGVSDTGQLLAREFLHNRHWGYRPVCFVDDDAGKRGVRIHGLPVLGNRYGIPALARQHHIHLVALAGDGDDLREPLAICQAAGVPARLVPTLADIVSGRAHATQLREVTVDDLLEREPLAIDYTQCAQAIRGRTVLVVGAAGSIGSELSRQLLALGPASLHLLDNNESGLYDLLTELLPRSEGCEVKLWVADVADRLRLTRVFQACRPQLVFHAAAYKHVPLLEEHPEEAFRVNVIGTLNVCQAAQRHAAQKLVFISTDKAVNPTSVMGASKRIGELLIGTLGQHGGTTFCAVRFGNVMGSRGSVVPLFWRQMERGGPISVTHPEVSRYFLTVPEAASLVIQGVALAQQGQVFLLDMGAEVKIVELAEKMMRLGGLIPQEMQIVYTGLRPGEKLQEELVGAGERLAPTRHPRVILVQRERPLAFSPQRLIAAIHSLEAERQRDASDLAARIHALARIDQPDAATQVG